MFLKERDDLSSELRRLYPRRLLCGNIVATRVFRLAIKWFPLLPQSYHLFLCILGQQSNILGHTILSFHLFLCILEY